MYKLCTRIYFSNYVQSHKLTRENLIQNTPEIFYFCKLLDSCIIIQNVEAFAFWSLRLVPNKIDFVFISLNVYLIYYQ